MQEAEAWEFLDLVQGEMSVIEYAVKFLQLSCFRLYLISTKEKKAKKFEQGLNSHIWIMMSCFDIQDFSQLVDKASIYEESLRMRLSTQIRRGGLKELVLRSEELGQLKGWRWGVFHPRSHKDVPLVTLQLCHKGIKHRSCAKSVTMYIKGPVGWQPGLAITATSLVTLAMTA
jgi:hypothetical protein